MQTWKTKYIQSISKYSAQFLPPLYNFLEANFVNLRVKGDILPRFSPVLTLLQLDLLACRVRLGKGECKSTTRTRSVVARQPPER